MALADVQRVLARIYTDGALRERFFADPEAIGASLGLAAEEARLLARLPAPQTHFYARSLQRKRRDLAAGLLPLTHRALGGAFETLFSRYAETQAGPKKGRADGMAFAAFLAQLPDSSHHVPFWVRDLTRYEAAWLQSTDPACRCLVRCFRYPVDRIAQSLCVGDEAGRPPAQTTVSVWVRLSRRGRTRHILFSLPPRPRNAPGRTTE